MAGPWLKFRGHLDNISNNMLIGAINFFNEKADTVKNQLTGEYGPVPATQRAYKAAGVGTIVVGDTNYGEGSSREHAVWALQNYGFKVVISSRFADIFRGNSLKGGLLTIILDQAEVEAMWEAIEADPATPITVNLEDRTVSYGSKLLPFAIDDYTRWRLMEGLDDIGLTLKQTDFIDSFEKKRPAYKPATLPIRS